MSGVAVLAESHISIHTWPEAGYAALDVFMCGSANPDACVPVLREAFIGQAGGRERIVARPRRLSLRRARADLSGRDWSRPLLCLDPEDDPKA